MQLPFKTNVIYEIETGNLLYEMNDSLVILNDVISNGRSSYILFEQFVREQFGLNRGVNSDHEINGFNIEQKSFNESEEDFHTAPSCTHGANRFGKTIKNFLVQMKMHRVNGDLDSAQREYDKAFQICYEKGYSQNRFYVYTNTGKFKIGSTLKVIFIPTEEMIQILSKDDPRRIPVSAIMQNKPSEKMNLRGAIKIDKTK